MNPTPSSRRAFLRSSAALAVGAGAALAQTPTLVSAAASAPSRRRPLFQNDSLNNFVAVPRLIFGPANRSGYVLPDSLSPEDRSRREAVLAHRGKWTIENGVVSGAQDPEGSGLGAYLLSKEVFGDFELEVEARPDWFVDTGVMLRTASTGSMGWQLLIDHRPNGCIGGIYGNAIGGFRAYPFVIDADIDEKRIPLRLKPGTAPDGMVVKPQYAGSIDEFLAKWRPGDWNHFKVRVVGAVPQITIWVNGVKTIELDARTWEAPGYDAGAVSAQLGAHGHIAFEVHSNDKLVGSSRWWPGAVCRWRNAYVTEL